jgi:hypothetical protein
MELTTELIIAAPPEVVWSVLTDFAKYPEWNPFIVEIAGAAVVGSRLHVRILPPGTSGITMRPTIETIDPPRELAWRGSLALAGLFSGTHRFVIEPHETGSNFVQSETFSGLLVPFFRRSLETSTRRGFEEMNHALRERAEALAGDAATPEVD